jgi:hypothetical protein
MKKIFAIVLVLILALSLLTACSGNENSNAPSGSGNNNPASQGDKDKPNNNDDPKSPEAAFAQFGLNVNDVKSGLGTPYDVTIQYGNAVSDTIYNRKAAWLEKSESDIDKEAGTAYNRKMFDLCKAASADGKVYRNKTNSSGDPAELASFDDILSDKALINFITWSYKVDGMWVDVYMDWSMLGDEIGINMIGSGSY